MGFWELLPQTGYPSTHSNFQWNLPFIFFNPGYDTVGIHDIVVILANELHVIFFKSRDVQNLSLFYFHFKSRARRNDQTLLSYIVLDEHVLLFSRLSQLCV